MVTGVIMLKEHAVALFGTQSALAETLGYTRQHVSQWPDPLPQKYADQVVGAAYRCGKPKAAISRLSKGQHPFPSSGYGARQCV